MRVVEEARVLEAARPRSGSVGGRMTGAGPRWLLPYLVIVVVVVVELAADRLSVGGFVALAPLLASRLSSRRGQVVAAGVTALLVGLALGAYTGKAVGLQLAVRLLLIALATLFALVNWDASRREQSALERAADTIQMAAGLAAGVEPEEAYAQLARSARTLYAAHAAAVYRRHDDELVAVAQARDQGVARMPARLARASFPGAFGAQPRRASVRAGVTPEASLLEARGLGSLLWLPLLDRAGDLLGTIVLAWQERDPPLSAQALETSERFASLGARAISGSERVRAQTEVLAQVQALLLTTPPSWAGGYRIGVRYQSASGLAQIGGDFYDVVEVDDLGLAFIVADARGKGLEASSLAAVLKGAFRTLAGEAAGPARILHRLDRLVAREGGDEDFVTALAGRMYPNGRVVLAAAGAPPPLGGGPRLVQVAAPLGLGTQANESYGLLRPGQRLICYTDGLVEARNTAGEFIDRARFEEAVAAGSLTEALDRLVDLVVRHAEGRHEDDLALLGLEYDPTPPA
jgi:Stage II sporulation protein E (SpoIIE)